MSKRAIEFFEAWVLEHVNPVQFREHTAEASRLTDLCIEDATKVGSDWIRRRTQNEVVRTRF
jgi:hypothetical protein